MNVKNMVTIQNSTYILKYEPSSLLVRGIFYKYMYWMNPKQRKIRSILSLF